MDKTRIGERQSAVRRKVQGSMIRARDQGAASGRCAVAALGKENPNLNFHRRVRVTGAVGDNGVGLLTLFPASLAGVVILKGASPVEPLPVATGDVSAATEGLLVEITGVLTRPIIDDLPFGYQVYLDDGSGETQVFVTATSGINPFAIPFLEKGAAVTVVGSSGQFLSQYEVLPRHPGDIRPANP